MKKISIDEAACRGCRLCRKGCPVGAIEIYGGVAHIGEACVSCGKCVKNCPFHAVICEENL